MKQRLSPGVLNRGLESIPTYLRELDPSARFLFWNVAKDLNILNNSKVRKSVENAFSFGGPNKLYGQYNGFQVGILRDILHSPTGTKFVTAAHELFHVLKPTTKIFTEARAELFGLRYAFRSGQLDMAALSDSVRYLLPEIAVVGGIGGVSAWWATR